MIKYTLKFVQKKHGKKIWQKNMANFYGIKKTSF